MVMIFTLQRYIFRELVRVFALASVALALMLSLGSILRPIRQYGVGPGQVVHLLGYTLPVTLTFVLPMAALFAAALIYGRFAADNELDACRASGISPSTLVYPGLFLAIIVAIATLILSFYVVPAYVRRAARATQDDAKQILFRNIQRKGYYHLPNQQHRIYADAADIQNNRLIGAIVAEVKDGKIKQLITAEQAEVRFEPHKRFNDVKIIATNVYKIDADSGVYMQQLPISMRFGRLLGDKIKFKKIDEMKAIQNDLMRFYPIAEKARRLYSQIATELLFESISSKIADPMDRFYRFQSRPDDTKIASAGQDFYIDLTADNCILAEETTLQLKGNITVLQHNISDRRLIATWKCDEAVIELSGDELDPTVLMTLKNANRETAVGPGALAYRYTFRNLQLPSLVTEKLGSDVMQTINSAAVYLKNPSPILQDMSKDLRRKIASALAQIDAEVHSRMVFGLGCIWMILIGIALGIRFKGGHLLSAFGAASIPAAALVVCIMMGRNITKNLAVSATLGVAVMWAGFVVLGLLTLILYCRLLKN